MLRTECRIRGISSLREELGRFLSSTRLSHTWLLLIDNTPCKIEAETGSLGRGVRISVNGRIVHREKGGVFREKISHLFTVDNFPFRIDETNDKVKLFVDELEFEELRAANLNRFPLSQENDGLSEQCFPLTTAKSCVRTAFDEIS